MENVKDGSDHSETKNDSKSYDNCGRTIGNRFDYFRNYWKKQEENRMESMFPNGRERLIGKK